MPSGPISKLPLGILGFLGIKSQGQYPNSLGDIITPTWDQLELFGAAHPVDQVTTGNPVVGSFNAFLTVPQTEIWRLQNVTILVATGAGVTLTWWIASQNPNSVTLIWSPETAQVASTSRISFARDVWLSPGDSIGIFAAAVVGAPTANINARRIVLPI